MIFLLLLGIGGLLLLLWPTVSPLQLSSRDVRRLELEEEKALLLDQVAELRATDAQSALLTREKVRLNAVLHELDQLPAPDSLEPRPVRGLALGTLLGVLALLLLGSFTFLKDWRLSGLSPQERTQLTQATLLPQLERRALSSKAVADYAAWGDAAWEAQQYQLAARAYTQLLLQDRGDPKAMRRVGFFLLQDQKMAEQGLSFIQRSLNADPKAPEGHLLYGYALGIFGQYPQAIRSLRAYQSLAPDSHEADDLLLEYQRQSGQKLDGALVFGQNCASCHGSQGEGGTAPALRGSVALKNPAAVREIVLNGATGMPAFPQLKGKQLDALVEYLGGWR